MGKNKLKVSLVVSDLSESGAGRWGGAVRPFLLSQALKSINCEVEIVGFSFGEMASSLADSEIPIFSLPGRQYPGFLKSVSNLQKRIDGDIIYAYKPKPSSFGVSLLRKLQTRQPVILDIDDWELSWYGGDKWKYRRKLKQFARDLLKPNGELRNPDHPLYLKWLENWVSSADVVTTHTQFIQNRFGGVYLPNGKNTTLFDPSLYDSEASRKHHGLSEFRIIMFPGAPRPYKGVEDVLIALEQIDEPDLKLVIVGGSPYDEYDTELRTKWGHRIIQLPKFPANVMPEIVSAAHLIVVPQRDVPAAQAQFPLKLTDGMAMAKPVLATRVGDIPNILGDTGYLVAPSSPEQLAERIKWIFNHLEEANIKGREARERCMKFYSINSMAEILSDLLPKVLGYPLSKATN